MRMHRSNSSQVSSSGLSLLELIGVLAVLAILAAVLVPALIHQFDRLAAQKETAALESLGNALLKSITRNRYIPAHTNWAATVASELGVGTNDVLVNGRRRTRQFLVDPMLEIGTNGAGLPYRQNNSGSVVLKNGVVTAPVSPRVILISSISEDLPGTIVSGIPTTNDFNAIWNWNDAGTALPPSATWAAWKGRAEDIKVQRVNLSSVFVQLLLTTYSSSGLGRYSVDWMNTNTVATSAGMEGWYIQDSILALIKHDGVLDSQQVLKQDSSYVYDQDAWRGSLSGLSPAGGLDIGNIVDKFLAAPRNENPNVPANQQATVVQTMMDYMKAYEDWSAAGFPTGGAATYQAAKNKQNLMMTAVSMLYQSGGGSADYFPPEVPCPP